MEKLQNVRKLLPRQVALATVTIVAVVAMAVPGEAAQRPGDLTVHEVATDSTVVIDVDTKLQPPDVGDKAADDLSIEAEAGVAPDGPDNAADDLSVEAEAGVEAQAGSSRQKNISIVHLSTVVYADL